MLTIFYDIFYHVLGTYGAISGLMNYTDCTACTSGQYCETMGLTMPTGSCDPGHYCVQGMYLILLHNSYKL